MPSGQKNLDERDRRAGWQRLLAERGVSHLPTGISLTGIAHAQDLPSLPGIETTWSCREIGGRPGVRGIWGRGWRTGQAGRRQHRPTLQHTSPGVVT